MNPTIKDRLLSIASFPLLVIGVPILHALFWWSEKVDGVEPKSGQSRYDHKDINGEAHYRHAGFKHRNDAWKPVGKLPPGFSEYDIMSLYPSVVKLDDLGFIANNKLPRDMTPQEKAEWDKNVLNSRY